LYNCIYKTEQMTDEAKQEILAEIESMIIDPVFKHTIKKECIKNELCSLQEWDIKKEYWLRVFAIEQIRIRFEREKNEMN